MPETFLIIHLDDEPESVEFIVEGLQVECIASQKTWRPPSIHHEPGDDCAYYSFPISPDAQRTVRYCICETADAFKREFAARGQNPCLVIVDLMQEAPTSGLQPYGLKAFDHAVGHNASYDDLLVFTGFARVAKDHHLPPDFPAHQIVSKPADAVALIDRIIDRFRLGSNPV